MTAIHNKECQVCKFKYNAVAKERQQQTTIVTLVPFKVEKRVFFALIHRGRGRHKKLFALLEELDIKKGSL